MTGKVNDGVTSLGQSKIRNMANCCFIFSVTAATFAAMIVGLYWYQDLPEGLPDDQKFSARFVGAHLDICRFLVGFRPGQGFWLYGIQGRVNSGTWYLFVKIWV